MVKKLQIYMYMKYLHVGIYKITCSWLCFHDVQIVSSSVEKREISHLDKQKRYNTLRCIAVQTSVNFDLSPWNSLDIVALVGCFELYRKREKVGNKTWPFLYWHYYIIFVWCKFTYRSVIVTYNHYACRSLSSNSDIWLLRATQRGRLLSLKSSVNKAI